MRENLGLLLTKRASLSPRLEGLVEVELGRRFTFHALNARANQTANLLLALGVRRGDRVALLLQNSAEFVESFFAIAKIGAIVVPLNWRLVADELAEIENVILSHPKVREVAVIGQASARWGESPLAVVVRQDSSLMEADVLAYCQGKLARFKQPRGVRFIDEIPRNPAGKVLKRLLRERFPEPARD